MDINSLEQYEINILALIPEGVTICVYISIQNELPTRRIIPFLLKRNRVGVPKVRDTNNFDVVEITSIPTNKGPLSFPEPKESRIISPKEIHLYLIPGTKFDLKGNRKGRGGGHYDRYLEHAKGLKIGLTKDEYLIEKLTPQPWDVPMDIIITPTKVLHINSQK